MGLLLDECEEEPHKNREQDSQAQGVETVCSIRVPGQDGQVCYQQQISHRSGRPCVVYESTFEGIPVEVKNGSR